MTAVFVRDATNVFCHDSKLLTPFEQRVLFQRWHQSPQIVWAQYFCESTELDHSGKTHAWRHAVREAVRQCRAALPPECLVDRVVIDGKDSVELDLPVITQIGGDRLYLGVALASMLGKEVRDARVVAWAERYPAFTKCLQSGKGYGTATHRALVAAGHLTPYHRRSYQPLRGLRARQGLDPFAIPLVLHVAASVTGCFGCGGEVPENQGCDWGVAGTKPICDVCVHYVDEVSFIQLPSGERVALE